MGFSRFIGDILVWVVPIAVRPFAVLLYTMYAPAGSALRRGPRGH